MKSMMLTACAACAKMNVTNNCDVQITMWIMLGIVAVVAICAFCFVFLKCKELKASALSETDKRKWAVEDKQFKRKTELVDMKLTMLKDSEQLDKYNEVIDKFV